MPTMSPPARPSDVRAANAVSYRATIRRARSRSAARMERPAGPSSSTGRSAMRRAGMSAAPSTLRRRTMPRLMTHWRGARGEPGAWGLPAGRVEARVGGRQAGLLEGFHQLAQRLRVVDPAEELPDGTEVVDVVDEG